MPALVQEVIKESSVAEVLSLQHRVVPDEICAPVTMITGQELAVALRYEGATASFRKFCKSAGISPLPGRKDCFDPVAVRLRLNAIQGIGANEVQPQSALDRSRIRRDAQR